MLQKLKQNNHNILALLILLIYFQNVQANTPTNESFYTNSSIHHHHRVCTNNPLKCILMAVFLGLLIVCSIVGNSFVIAAIYLERSLQNVANYLIVSLACADLMVAIMVKKNTKLNFLTQKF